MTETIGPEHDSIDTFHPKQIELFTAIVDLMLEKGFHETTVRDIAAAADWNMATLYVHVKDKHELLFQFSRWLGSVLHKEFEAERDLNLPTATATLDRWMRAWLATCHRHSQYIRFFYRELPSLRPEHRTALGARHEAYIDEVQSIIERGCASGEFRPVNSRIAAAEIVFAGHFWSLRSWTLPPHTDFAEYLEFTVNFYGAGLWAVGRSNENGTGGHL